ncbi:recombinase family protein [Streptomyces sp. NPDC020379]|uniref:recombinase family protein n=1 Tax=Streptomyces sp. NPDC020379 TaxID=3365071 RepID=UPI0037942067
MTEKKRAAIYCKVRNASEWGADKSMAVQVARCTKWAEANNAFVVDTLTDSERPADEVLMEAIASGNYDLLVAAKEETYGRRESQLLQLAWFAEDRGVHLYEANSGTDLTSADNQHRLRVMGELVKTEAARTRTEIAELAEHGLVRVELDLPMALLEQLPDTVRQLDGGPVADVLRAVLDGMVTLDETDASLLH